MRAENRHRGAGSARVPITPQESELIIGRLKAGERVRVLPDATLATILRDEGWRVWNRNEEDSDDALDTLDVVLNNDLALCRDDGVVVQDVLRRQ